MRKLLYALFNAVVLTSYIHISNSFRCTFTATTRHIWTGMQTDIPIPAHRRRRPIRLTLPAASHSSPCIHLRARKAQQPHVNVHNHLSDKIFALRHAHHDSRHGRPGRRATSGHGSARGASVRLFDTPMAAVRRWQEYHTYATFREEMV